MLAGACHDRATDSYRGVPVTPVGAEDVDVTATALLDADQGPVADALTAATWNTYDAPPARDVVNVVCVAGTDTGADQEEPELLDHRTW